MAIDYHKEDSVAIFTINRPEAMGALNLQAFQELHDTLVDFRDDDKLLVGIITGTGNKAFCCGADIKELLPLLEKTANKPWELPATVMRGFDLWKPLIAACNGLALGGGLEIALACDVRIASQNARFGLPEVTLSLIPGLGGTQRLPRIIPWGAAAEMLFTGKIIDAQEAYRVGLVNKVVPLSDLMPTAKQLAQDICQAGPLAVRAAKEAMLRGANMSLGDGLGLEDRLFRHLFSTKDLEEGIRAFVEKRKPEFRGE